MKSGLDLLRGWVAAFFILSSVAAVLVRGDGVAASGPGSSGTLLFVVERGDGTGPDPLAAVRAATIARYSAGGLKVIPIDEAEIWRWAGKSGEGAGDLKRGRTYLDYAWARGADAIGGIRPYRCAKLDQLSGTYSGWIWNLRRGSQTEVCRLYGPDNTEAIELLDEYDARRPVEGGSGEAQSAPKWGTSMGPFGVEGSTLQPALRSRRPFELRWEFAEDEPSSYYGVADQEDRVVLGLVASAMTALSAGETSVPIERVTAGFPAEEAGLRAGDRVIDVDGKPVGDREELRRVISRHAAGDVVTLLVDQDGKRATKQVTAVSLRARTREIEARYARRLLSEAELFTTAGARVDGGQIAGRVVVILPDHISCIVGDGVTAISMPEVVARRYSSRLSFVFVKQSGAGNEHLRNPKDAFSFLNAGRFDGVELPEGAFALVVKPDGGVIEVEWCGDLPVAVWRVMEAARAGN